MALALAEKLLNGLSRFAKRALTKEFHWVARPTCFSMQASAPPNGDAYPPCVTMVTVPPHSKYVTEPTICVKRFASVASSCEKCH